jgi:hypothetical protein
MTWSSTMSKRRTAFDPTIFGLFLEAKRIARGLSRAELARQAGVTLDAVRNAVDRRFITASAFRELCAWQGEAPEIFAPRRALP